MAEVVADSVASERELDIDPEAEVRPSERESSAVDAPERTDEMTPPGAPVAVSRAPPTPEVMESRTFWD